MSAHDLASPVEVRCAQAHAAESLRASWAIGGLDCPDCARSVARSVEMLPGVLCAELNFANAVLLVEHEIDSDPSALVVRSVERAGHTAMGLTGVAVSADRERAASAAESAHEGILPAITRWTRSHRTEVSVVGSGVFIVLGWIAILMSRSSVAVPPVLVPLLFGLGVVFGMTLLAPRALNSVASRTLDMNILMSVAVLGASAIGQLEEAATVVFLFALGGWLESRALARTRSSIRQLMELAPEVAHVSRHGVGVDLPLADILVGDTITVRPGERIGLDGVIESGSSAVDESAVTGEPVPVYKAADDALYAGSLNTGGLLTVRVTAPATDSTLARIVYLVEEAQAAKAPSQVLIDRFSRVYTPVAVGIAVLVAVVPPLLALAFGPLMPAQFGEWDVWVYRALVVLVASCPCALVISTPVTFVSAISRAGRDGVLVKGGAALETVARIDAVAFDKTGTLTVGKPSVTAVVATVGRRREEVLRLANALESNSNHPLAGAVREHARAEVVREVPVSGVEEMPGRGVAGIVGGIRCEVISPAFAEEIAHIPGDVADAIEECESRGLTVLVVVEDGEAIGIVAVADPVRDEALASIVGLRSSGIRHAVMLTGDNERTAAAVAGLVGVDAHMARLLPEDKVAAIARLRERYGTVAMVGDGVNDAPALAAADLGIAMGAAGSDAAL
ncbi:MAG: cation-translocating P-type ATPase [Coriobacteriia bacterium]|nr:cation-translocating P-type ATPase [Coriobacteriia bacterium]